MSVTSKQILEATGLKSQKTLSRWVTGGVIPKPYIDTHPAGRGKIAYWPDWVRERCIRIAELQRQGHSLRSALTTIELERMQHLINEVETATDIDDTLSKKIRLPEGEEIDLGAHLHAFIVRATNKILPNTVLRKDLLESMRLAGIAARSLKLFEAGYNPVCLYDGGTVEVVPDFVVAHRLSDESSAVPAWMVIPLLPPIREAFSALGRELPTRVMARPAPKVWALEGDAYVEYSIYIGGSIGFELMRESARIVGHIPVPTNKKIER